VTSILTQYYRYIIAGFIVTAFDFLIYITCTEVFHVYYLHAVCFSFVFASVLQYFISIKYVFENRSYNNAYHEFTIFILLGIVSLILYEILMFGLTDLMKIQHLISKVLVTGIMFTFNFATRKFILFR